MFRLTVIPAVFDNQMQVLYRDQRKPIDSVSLGQNLNIAIFLDALNAISIILHDCRTYWALPSCAALRE